ncbi:MAG: glycosyltransferase family 39 protein [Thermoanaerobaculales bacterium]|jgi:hypothetical protein|nr:glycosyltransferase family 39 protein [Thermoanaerobaculales bacterium]
MAATVTDAPPDLQSSRRPHGRAAAGLPAVLFGLGVAVYLLTRVVGLADYPIFFFCDEAVQTNVAADFVRDGCRSIEGELFPTFFKNADRYNLGPSVYAQVLPFMAFGKSIVVTRLTATLVTLLAFVWVCLMLRDIFGLEHWWVGGLLLSVTPAWFLHSRTAFETTMMASFYAGFLYEYFRYRDGETRRLYLALLWGSLAFYSYSPGRVIMVVTGLAFLLADLSHHLRHRPVVTRAAGLLAILVLPFVRFIISHPHANAGQLRVMAAYWFEPRPLSEKLGIYASEYLAGLDPRYWFIPNTDDFHRHLMGPNPHILVWVAPFVAIGLIVAVVRFRRPAHRLLLLSAIIIPCAAAIVGHSITRLMALVIPAAVLGGIGVDAAVALISRRSPARSRLVGVAVFSVLALVNLRLLTSALEEGPTWHRNYGMGGMQWGARQLYTAVDEMLDEDPNRSFLISPDWTNGADNVARFFLAEDAPKKLGSLMPLLHDPDPAIESMILVAIPTEYEAVKTSGKFAEIDELRVLPYPDGTRGFTFLRLTYRDDIAEILAAEAAERRRLRSSYVAAMGRRLTVRHSDFDIGSAELLFDGDDDTLARTSAANPMMLAVETDEPIEASAARVVFGSTNVEIGIELFAPGSDEPLTAGTSVTGTIEEPWATVSFPHRVRFDRATLTLTDLRQTDPGHVHLWELTFME